MEIIKKQFKYRGQTIEDLKKLDVREFAKLVRSRERRSILRNFRAIEEFVNRARKKQAQGKMIKTHSRDIVVVPEMIGLKVGVHKGNAFVNIIITEEMLGHRLGEFAVTRSKIKHSKKGVGATKGTKHKSKK